MTKFTCKNCGAQSPSWVGRCPECQEWNTYIEENSKIKDQKSKVRNGKDAKPISIQEIKLKSDQRIETKISELDRVLGGGIVKGSAVLIAGSPGIGKSTLVLQLASSLSKNAKVLYIAGEESPAQIKMRADRLKINDPEISIFNNTNLADIEEEIDSSKPDFIIVDSIQTIEMDEIDSSSGSVSQVKECAARLIERAKDLSIPLLITGQVTKEGAVAGPKILEHMVDTVLYFEGDQDKLYRILRSTKNRFGSTNEVGIFEMTGAGLIEVKDPSKILLEAASLGLPGSCVTAAIEGTRPMMVEIQALLSFSKFPSPRRVVTGLDYNKCAVILGVLDRKAGVKAGDSDVYLSVASGVYIDETAVDLPVAAAIVSCVKNKGIDPKTIVVGEIGLTGEIRSVPNIETRLNEAQRLGFKTAIIPSSNKISSKGLKGMDLKAVSNIKEAIEALFN